MRWIFLLFLFFQLGSWIYSVDIYVFNVGQGNCILVVAEVANNESLDSKLKEKRALIVDCGTGSGAESNYGDLGKRKFEDKLRELRLQEQRGDTGDTSLAV